MQAFSGSEEIDSQCRGYCYDAMKPLLDHVKMSYNQTEGKHPVTLQDLEEHLEKVKNQAHDNSVNTENILSRLEKNLLEKIESSKNSLEYIEIDFQDRLSKTLDEALQKQNQKIDTVLQTLKKSFKQQVDKLQEQVDTNIRAVLARLHKIKQEENRNKILEIELKANKLTKSDKIDVNSEGSGFGEDDSYEVVAENFKKIGTKHYHISKEVRVTWKTANIECSLLGGALVTFESDLEFYEVVSHLEPINQKTNYWTSLNDIDDEGTFVSIATGKKAPYTNWRIGEPNNENNGYPENCVQVTHSDGFYMNDVPCDAHASYICELAI